MAAAFQVEQVQQVPLSPQAGAPFLCAVLTGCLPTILANRVHDWWADRLVDGQPPHRHDFDIANFVSEVRYVSISKYDFEKQDYKMRVGSTEILEINGQELTGKFFFESLAADAVKPARAYFALLREQTILGFHVGRSPHKNQPWQLMSSVHLPIRYDDSFGFIHYSKVLDADRFEVLARDVNARLAASGPRSVAIFAKDR